MPDGIHATVTIWRRDKPWELGVWECPKLEVSGHQGWAWPGGVPWTHAAPELVHLMADQRSLVNLGGIPMSVVGVIVQQDEPTGPLALFVELRPWPA